MIGDYILNPDAMWAGEVPANWPFFKGKYIFGERFEKGNDKNLELLSPTQKYGVIPQRMYDELSGMRAVKVKEDTDLSTFKTVRKGDFCISLRSFQGGFEYSKYEGVVSPAYHILFPKKKIYDGYYKYLFKEQSFIAEMNSYCQSLRDGKNISYEDFGKTLIPYPPLSEQQAIADYLDARCSKIDEIIAEATASIEEYKELKQAVIFEAVTKGLDKNVPMKDSGVEWIGKIPTSWRSIRVKYLLSHLIDCPHETPNYVENGEFCVIRTADQDLGFLRSDENMYRLEKGEYLNRIRRLSLDKDDIVYGREGERWGLACLVPKSNKYCLGQRMLHFRCKTDMVIPRFMMWSLNSVGVRMQGVIDTLGSTSPHVNISTVRNFIIPLPDMEAQQIIADYLDEKMSHIDSLISEKQSLISDLQAYKKSLIYEVVTGKRRVV